MKDRAPSHAPSQALDGQTIAPVTTDQPAPTVVGLQWLSMSPSQKSSAAVLQSQPTITPQVQCSSPVPIQQAIAVEVLPSSDEDQAFIIQNAPLELSVDDLPLTEAPLLLSTAFCDDEQLRRLADKKDMCTTNTQPRPSNFVSREDAIQSLQTFRAQLNELYPITIDLVTEDQQQPRRRGRPRQNYLDTAPDEVPEIQATSPSDTAPKIAPEDAPKIAPAHQTYTTVSEHLHIPYIQSLARPSVTRSCQDILLSPSPSVICNTQAIKPLPLPIHPDLERGYTGHFQGSDEEEVDDEEDEQDFLDKAHVRDDLYVEQRRARRAKQLQENSEVHF